MSTSHSKTTLILSEGGEGVT